MKLLPALALALLGTATASAQQVPPGAPETPAVDPNKAYLFAHMMKGSYGVLYYSVIIRAPGMVQIALSKSNSAHAAKRVSFDRTAL